MRRDARLLLAPLGLLLAMFVVLSITTRGFILVDTYDVLYGSAAATRCLGGGVLSGCSGVSQFALLQYLPSAVFHETGYSLESAANALVTLNGLAVLGVLAIVAVAVTRLAGAAAGALAAAAVIGSPLLWYAHGGYAEPLAALAITAYVVALLTGAAPWVIGGAMFAAGISKETAVPLLLGAAAVVWLIRERRFQRGELVAMAAGGAAAVAANAAFNLFRFGTVFNEYYTQPALHARPSEVPGNLAALLWSPTGGLLWMWPAVALVVGVAASVAVRRRRLREPGLAIAALSCVVLLSSAMWHGPLGGTTWGPRLLIPWLPALLVLGLAAYPAVTREAVARLAGSRAAVAAVGVCLIVLGLPHMLVTVDSARHTHGAPGLTSDIDELAIQPFLTDATCPRAPSAFEDREYDRKCLEHRTWHKGVALARPYGKLFDPLMIPFAIVWAAAMAGLIGYARARARSQLPALA